MPQADTVLLLHGFAGHPIQMSLLARRLRRAGYHVANIGYPSWRWPADRIVDHLHRQVIAASAHAAPRLHCVGHSMGGLLLRAYLARHRPANLGRVVMLGTPHGGSELADLAYRLRLARPILNGAGPLLRTGRAPAMQELLGLVDYPLGIIAGDRPMIGALPHAVFPTPNDGKVSVAATHCPGESDHLTLPLGHTALVHARPAADQLIYFLRHGRFER